MGLSAAIAIDGGCFRVQAVGFRGWNLGFGFVVEGLVLRVKGGGGGVGVKGLGV